MPRSRSRTMPWSRPRREGLGTRGTSGRCDASRARVAAAAAIAAGLVVVAGGCADLLGPGGEDRIEENRDRWRSARPAAYRFTYARNCFCAGTDPVEIRVEGEEVVQVTPVEGEGSPPFPISSYPSIDGLFDQLREWDSRDPYRATMEFDDGLGYPTRAFFDFRETVADEEMGFRVSGFRALDETEE